MRIRIVAAIIVFATAAFLVSGCSGSNRGAGTPTPGVTERPSAPVLARAPRAALAFGSVEIAGGIGTRCWELACIDMAGPVTGGGAIEMPPGEPFDFVFEEGAPDEVVVSWFEAPSPPPAVENGEMSWSIDPRTAKRADALRAPEEPGLYILSAFARWEGKGDVSYGWYIDVK